MTSNKAGIRQPRPVGTALRAVSLSENVWTGMTVMLAFCFARVLSFIFRQPTPPSPDKRRLDGQTAIVTGANGGIGLAITRDLFQRGCTVTMACRSSQRAQEARRLLLEEVNGTPGTADRLKIMTLDSSNLDSVRAFATSWSSKAMIAPSEIDFLFLNAGFAERSTGMGRFTKEGLDLFYQHLLVNLLLPFLSPSARIIITSSQGAFYARFSPAVAERSTANVIEKGFHYPSYLNFHGSTVPRFVSGAQDTFHYAHSKAFQVLFADTLQQILVHHQHPASVWESSGKTCNDRGPFDDVRVNTFHPGLVRTKIFDVYSTKSFAQSPLGYVGRYMMHHLGLDPKDGIRTAMCLALSDDELGGKSILPGAFYEFDKVRNLPWYASLSPAMRRRLWTRFNNDAGLTDADWILSKRAF
ncbi:NAD(P)-binding protein [Acaromyces ingoldii]|uniref:NAD(P)-binding protein n=1 Tax=Acaromyces ingoldii TaxID=215250 RepID=A0A316YR55_9BASI|nr:NAD(P)-binding protein [Acaromyces ingoldii]PWN90245.1 NAD(P)-binding protein [Acaromyces ingoldii]